MANQRFPTSGLASTGNTVTVVVVVLAYAATFAGYLSSLNSPSGPPFSLSTFLIAVVLGILYLWLLLSSADALTSVFGKYTTAAYFVIAIILMLAIEFLLRGSGGIWLIAMPLVAMTVTDLPPRWRWLVYSVIIAGISFPIFVESGSWSTTLYAAFTFGAAIVFVIVFVHLTKQAELAQEKSETLAGELEFANRQLTAYAVQAEELATTQERNRLAREIHDNLGHYLTVINVQIQAAQAVMAKDPDRAAQALTRAQQLTQEGLKAVRQSVSALRESPLGGRSLSEAVDALAREMQASGVLCKTEVVGDVRSLDPRCDLTLYRAVQEALTNARKHAHASRVDLMLDYSNPTTVSLTAVDNGIGAMEVDGDDRFGLLGLRERVRQLGGSMSIETSPGAGFRMQLSLPSEDLPAAVSEDTASGPAVGEYA